jgi:hypothetical protein
MNKLKELLKIKDEVENIEENLKSIKNDMYREIRLESIECLFTYGELQQIEKAINCYTFSQRIMPEHSEFYIIHQKIKGLLK